MDILKQPAGSFIISILRGDAPAWPTKADQAFLLNFQQLGTSHGLYPLIYYQYTNKKSWNSWPENTRNLIKRDAMTAAASELAVEHETATMLARLAENRIRPIILKGTAILHTHYPVIGLRRRGDTDILFQRRDIGPALKALESLGYQYVYRQGYLGQELGYAKGNQGNLTLPLDIHWRISSYVLFAQMLDFNEIMDSAVKIDKLSKYRCAMSPVHALLHACVHWAKHLSSGDTIPVLWLYDIYLLAKHLTREERNNFISLSAKKKLAQICAEAIYTVNKIFDCEALETLHDELSDKQQDEPAARMLKPDAPNFMMTDLLSMGFSHKLLNSLQDILFPPGAYVLRLYGKQNRLWLPWLYADRLSSGLIEYVRRRGFSAQ